MDEFGVCVHTVSNVCLSRFVCLRCCLHAWWINISINFWRSKLRRIASFVVSFLLLMLKSQVKSYGLYSVHTHSLDTHAYPTSTCVVWTYLSSRLHWRAYNADHTTTVTIEGYRTQLDTLDTLDTRDTDIPPPDVSSVDIHLAIIIMGLFLVAHPNLVTNKLFSQNIANLSKTDNNIAPWILHEKH